MPVREGRWVSLAQALEAKKAAMVIVDTPDEAPAQDVPAPKRTRRSRKAAEAAIADATGVTVSLDAGPLGVPVSEGDEWPRFTTN